MILPIYLYGQPVLRQEADDVDENYPDLKKLVENMYETMYESDGVGLAAPQIGLPIRLIVIDADVLKDTFPELEGVKMTLVNPELDILTDSPTVQPLGGMPQPPRTQRKRGAPREGAPQLARHRLRGARAGV